jgi:hypothetical protein
MSGSAVFAAQTLLSALVGDPLRTIARLLPDADRFRMRLACRTMRDHSEPVSWPLSRITFLHARSLAAYACDELPDFMLVDKTQMLALASEVGCVAVLAEVDARCGSAGGPLVNHLRACVAAAWYGRLEALVWLRGRGCSWSLSSARPQLVQGISRCCGTRTSTAAHWAGSRAPGLLVKGISRCCGMRTSMAARGAWTPAPGLRNKGISRF